MSAAERVREDERRRTWNSPEALVVLRWSEALSPAEADVLLTSSLGRLVVALIERSAAVRAETLAEVREAVQAEEEADGPMPDAVWSQFQMAVAWGDDRSGAEAIIRGTISATKKSILATLSKLEAP